MITLYVAVILQAGVIKETLGKGVYKTPEACYTSTQWPTTEGEKEEFKCLKMTGDFVDFKVIEVKK